MMRIQKGKDIPLKGQAEPRIVEAPVPKRVAVQPPDFRGLCLRLRVAEGQQVKAGETLLEDKANPAIRIVSPVSGRVAVIDRGEKRFLKAVIIEPDGRGQAVRHKAFPAERLARLNREQILARLMESGVWPCFRQRPFSVVANPVDTPKAIFVKAMNTAPLSPDPELLVSGQKEQLQAGLLLLRKLTQGDVHVCVKAGAPWPALEGVKDIRVHRFEGPHPAGNVSTFIHHIDPIQKGDVVWYLAAEDVIRAARAFLDGVYWPQKVTAVTGEGAGQRIYLRTVTGIAVRELLGAEDLSGMRIISGDILSGRAVEPQGFLHFYDNQITVIPECQKREFLGWMMPGFHKFTLSKFFASSFLPETPVSLNTDENGGHRAIVLNHLYDKYVPLDIMTNFLVRAVLSGDIEEAERLGLLECDEEDFALCTVACPSKLNIGQIIRQGLDEVYREG